MSEVLLNAAQATLDDALTELRTAVDGLTTEQLNRRLAGDGSNPLAVIATHALESTRSWLSLATGVTLPPRDRPAEFRAVADAGFQGWVNERMAMCRALLSDVETIDPARQGTAPWRTTHADEPVTAAWALLHAVGHLEEHVGHAHVMRDLLETEAQGVITPPS